MPQTATEARDVRGLPAQLRQQESNFLPATFNESERTIELVWTTGAGVLRYDWKNYLQYEEQLSLDGTAVDLSRLNTGAPLLNSHAAYDLNNVIGVVERAWIESGEGRAVVRFSERPEIASIVKDVRDGILRGVSVGYYVRTYEIKERQGQMPIYLAVDWQPYEISLVAVGADQGAGTRGQSLLDTTPCTFINRATAQTQENQTMPQPVEPNVMPPAQSLAGTPTADTDAVRRQAQEAERTRGLEIRRAARSLGLDDTDADSLIEGNVPLDQARAQLIDLRAERASISINPRVTATDRPSGDDPVQIRAAMAEAIAVRYGASATPSDQARQYSSHSIVDMATELLRSGGHMVRTRNKAQIIEEALRVQSRTYHSTSDFALLLGDTANRIMLSAYKSATPTYRLIASQKEFNDFKPHSFVRSGDFPMMKEVNESGEIQYGTMSESGEKVALATYGRIIGLTRQALINDSLGGFADMTRKAAARIPNFENQTVYALLAQSSGTGPKMSDGKTLFHSDHSNKAAAGTAIDLANLAAGMATFGKKKSRDGEPLNLRARYLLVGPDKELESAQVTTPIIPTKATDNNPYAGKLEVIVDGNVAGNKWYLFCDPNAAETLIYGYLNGATGPRVETRNGFNVEGVEFKVAMDFAAGVTDYIGGYFNPGA
jgi:hypothetical protein